MRKSSLLGAFLSAVAFLSSGLDADEETFPEKTGLPIGHAGPAFVLVEQNGRKVSLEALLKKGPVAVVFHRSVDWCMYCKLQMVQLQRILKEIEAAGGQVVGISYDSVGDTQSFRQPKQNYVSHCSRTRQQND